MVPVLVLLFVALWFILRGDLFCLTLCYFVVFLFSVLLALRLPRLGRRELILVLFVYLFDLSLLVSSSSCCLGRAAVCDDGTPWTFLLIIFNDTKTLVGHYVSSPRERDKRDRRDSRGDEREGQGRKRKRKKVK